MNNALALATAQNTGSIAANIADSKNPEVERVAVPAYRQGSVASQVIDLKSANDKNYTVAETPVLNKTFDI